MTTGARASGSAWFTPSLIAIVVVGFAARATWLLLVGDVALEGSTDQANYVWLARAWASGQFWTGSYRSPGYLAVVASGQLVANIVPLTLRETVGIGQLLLATGTIGVVGLAGRRWFGPIAGLTGAAIYAIWPNQVGTPAILMSEVPSTPLLFIATAILLWKPAAHLGARWCAVSALCTAVAVMMRPTLIAPAAVLGVLAGLSGPGQRRQRWCRGVAYVGVTAAMAMSWSALLSIRAEQPVVSLGTSGDFNLCLGNNPAATGRWSDEAVAQYCPWPVGADEFGQASHLRSKSITWILDNPGRQPGLVSNRIVTTFWHDHYALDYLPEFTNYEGPGDYQRLKDFFDRWWSLAVVGTAISLAPALIANRRASLWMIAVGASSLLIPAISIGDARYHDTLVPYMCTVIGAGSGATVRSIRSGVGVLRTQR